MLAFSLASASLAGLVVIRRKIGGYRWRSRPSAAEGTPFLASVASPPAPSRPAGRLRQRYPGVFEGGHGLYGNSRERRAGCIPKLSLETDLPRMACSDEFRGSVWRSRRGTGPL